MKQSSVAHPPSYRDRSKRRALAGLIVALGLLLSSARADDNGPLHFARLDLLDDRTLTQVDIIGYDNRTDEILSTIAGKFQRVKAALVPPPFQGQFRKHDFSEQPAAAKPKPAPVLLPTKTAPAAPPEKPQVWLVQNGVRQEPSFIGEKPKPATIVVASPSPASRPVAYPTPPFKNTNTRVSQYDQPEEQPSRTPAATQTNKKRLNHKAVAEKRAGYYYNHEYIAGSRDVWAGAATIELDEPEEITGWAGRYRWKGKAHVYYSNRSPSETICTFEVITEEKADGSIVPNSFTPKT